jgi:hypothetical protein
LNCARQPEALPFNMTSVNFPLFLRAVIAWMAACCAGVPTAQAQDRLGPAEAVVSPTGLTSIVLERLANSASSREGPIQTTPKHSATGADWLGVVGDSLRFLAIQHAFRLTTEPTTRKEIGGPFFKDYVDSIKGVGGWNDGDEFYVNYLGHPMEGAVAGFILIQNDSRSRSVQVDEPGYLTSRMKAMAFSAVYSAQFEIGPLSEAMIGNIGKNATLTRPNGGAGFVDLVITPTVGTAWLMGEDLLDRYVVSIVERRTSNRLIRVMLRSWLNPNRSMANMLRGKAPWYRDTRM